MGCAGKDREVERMKSPCVQDCPDRLPCGACRKTCAEFKEYEEMRLKEKKYVDYSNTHARERLLRDSFRNAQRGKRHMR